MELCFYEVPQTPELKVEITSSQFGQTERNLLAHIKGFSPDSWQLIVQGDGQIKVLQLAQIFRFATGGKKLWAHSTEGCYSLATTVSELEESLPAHLFIRISQSEIINISWVERFAITSSTNIAVIFKNEEKTYISRRYIPRVRATLQGLNSSRRTTTTS